MLSRLCQLIRKNPQFWWFLSFGLIVPFYFLSQLSTREHVVIHVPFDDQIPFVPAFIIPYVLLYPYMIIPMLVVCFKNPKAFVQQVFTMIPGWFLACAFFLTVPTCIDFRPDGSGEGLFLWLCRWIYSTDKPVNVMPSLHCYGAVVAYLTTLRAKLFPKKSLINFGMLILCILICASTVFVKQHSILDLIAGVAFGLVFYFIIDVLFRWRRKKHDPITL